MDKCLGCGCSISYDQGNYCPFCTPKRDTKTIDNSSFHIPTPKRGTWDSRGADTCLVVKFSDKN